MQSGRFELLRRRVEMAINDIGGEHVSGVRVRIAEEICKTNGWERIFIIEGIFVKLDHDQAERKLRSFRQLCYVKFNLLQASPQSPKLDDIASAGIISANPKPIKPIRSHKRASHKVMSPICLPNSKGF